MKSLFSLFVALLTFLGVFLIGTARAGGGLNLQLGGLLLNNDGVKLDIKKEPVKTEPPELGFTVVPSLKEVLDINVRPVPPGVEPTSKRDRIIKKKDYEEQIMEEIAKERPDINEINERRHKAGYYHVTLEEEAVHDTCPDGDHECEKEMLQWAAAPTDPKLDATEKKLKKS